MTTATTVTSNYIPTFPLTAELPAHELRSVLNEVNTPKPTPPRNKVGEHISWIKENVGGNQMFTLRWAIKIYDGENSVGSFYINPYPACCGLSIINDFRVYQTENLNAVFKELIEDICRTHCAPNIQFVAVKHAEYEEQSYINDDDEEEYEDVATGKFAEAYNYDWFVRSLISTQEAELIKGFVNANSDNLCDVYQFINPRNRSAS